VVRTVPAQVVKFKDLEAIVTARMVRGQVHTDSRQPKSTDRLETDVDLPLPPGPYQLAVVAKNLTINQVGSVSAA
jgi:hypothetical protein